MKQITQNTILKQGNNEYYAVNVDDIIYWLDKNADVNFSLFHYAYGKIYPTLHDTIDYLESTKNIKEFDCYYNYITVIAQSKNVLSGIPVIDLNSYITSLAYNYFNSNEHYKISHSCHYAEGYKANKNTYTEEDIKKAIKLALKATKIYRDKENYKDLIFKKISQILKIEVDNEFYVINYE